LFIDGKKITDEGILKHFIEDFEEFNASNIEAYFAHETFKVFNDSNMEYASLFGFLKDTIYYSMDCDSIINISNTKEITNRSPNMVIAALNNEPGEPVEISNETNIYSSEIAYRYTNGELFIPKLGYKYATVGYEESGVIENHFNPQVVHELKNDTLAIIEYEVVFN
ncbi:MAG: hypothetical protein MI922_17910, partial [Bacteroidales bacterium]|nr:hypothetical protein [Bacteroidales bacterium]